MLITNPEKAAVGGCRPLGMVGGGGGTAPWVSWHRALQQPGQPFWAWGAVYPGGVAALLYIRKARVLELDGA